MSNSLQPHGMQPARLLYPWDFPGKNTGVGCHFFLQRIFLGIKPMSPMSPALAARFYTTEPPEKPWYTHHTVPNIDALISLGNKYPVIRIFWTRVRVLIFLRRKIFFLLTLFPLFDFLNKSHNSPIKNLLFPVIKIKIPAHLHLHNSFGRMENVKQWMDKWTLTETRMVCQNPLLLKHYSLLHPKIYATRQ